MNQLNERFEPSRGDLHPLPECPDCGSVDCSVKHREQTFQYGRGAEGIDLNCYVPVYDCNQCGYEWTGAEAEDARQIAICRHLGRLTPDEVLGIRESVSSQAEFSRVTGFGVASLSRWETGAQVQNVSSDRLLRLIQLDQRNLERLRRFADAEGRSQEPKLKCIEITPEVRARESAFQLRRELSKCT